MQHYICKGSCKGESSEAGICQTAFCDHEGESLIECSCTDGLHDKAADDDEDSDWDVGE